MNQAINDFLDGLDSDTLIILKQEIERRLENMKDEKIRQLAGELALWGISPSELNGHAKQSTKVSGIARYRNPHNPSQTWTGKGKPPNWFKDCLDEGTEKNDMLIP